MRVLILIFGLILLLSLIVCSASAEELHKLSSSSRKEDGQGQEVTGPVAKNHVITTVLANGDKAVKIRIGDVLVEDKFISSTNANAGTGNGKDLGLRVRQISSSDRILLQMIHQLKTKPVLYLNSTNDNGLHEKLLKCEDTNDGGRIEQFRLQFEKDLAELKFNPDSHGQISGNWTQSFGHGEGSFPEFEGQTSLTTQILDPENLTPDLLQILDIKAQHKHCRRLQRKSSKTHQQEKRQQANNVTTGLYARKKRAALSRNELTEGFRVPGTRWCGVSTSAREWNNLGGFVGADKCCRFHDACPYNIFGLSEKYGYFNWGFWTISHCACDERFRSCLRQTNTRAANAVGKLFFNAVRNPCFVLKVKKVCVARDVEQGGKCLQYEKRKEVEKRDPIPY